MASMSFSSRFALRFIRPDPRGRVTDPVGDVVSFIHSFEEKYGQAHPVFYQGTYSQVSSGSCSANIPETHILFCCESSSVIQQDKTATCCIVLFTVVHVGTE